MGLGIYKLIRSLLGFSELKKNKIEFCKDCGTKFDGKKKIGICKRCIKEAIHFKPKTFGRLQRRFLKNPSKCPRCKNPLDLSESQFGGQICPKCKRFYPAHAF